MRPAVSFASSGQYLIPPPNFGMVDDQLYRCGQPSQLNFPFMEKLGLKTVIWLAPEAPGVCFSAFISDHGISLVNVGAAAAAAAAAAATNHRGLTEDCATTSTAISFARDLNIKPQAKVKGNYHEDHAKDLEDDEGLDDGEAVAPGTLGIAALTAAAAEAAAKASAAGVAGAPYAGPRPLAHSVSATQSQQQQPTAAAGGGASGSLMLGAAGAWDPISEDVVVRALGALAVAAQPAAVICQGGRHRTGTVIGCLRKQWRWSLSAILDEYRRYAGPKVRALNEQFIELFDTDLLLQQQMDAQRRDPTCRAASLRSRQGN